MEKEYHKMYYFLFVFKSGSGELASCNFLQQGHLFHAT